MATIEQLDEEVQWLARIYKFDLAQADNESLPQQTRNTYEWIGRKTLDYLNADVLELERADLNSVQLAKLNL
jgi:hypothetical protein